jgi:transposase-like protein
MPSSSKPTVSRSSRRYSESFKVKAARMVLEQKDSIKKVAQKLQCAPMSVRKWVEQYRDRSKPTQEMDKSPVRKLPPSVSFLPVQVVDDSTLPRSQQGYEIITPTGLTLRLPGETAIRAITELVRELESVSC